MRPFTRNALRELLTPLRGRGAPVELKLHLLLGQGLRFFMQANDAVDEAGLLTQRRRYATG